MAGLLQGLLRSRGIAARLAARAYAAAVGDLFHQTVAGVDFGSGRLLDLGCGPGDLTARVAASHPGLRLVAADLSHAMLVRAGRRLPEAVPRVAADAMALPFADRSFDAVLSVAALKFWPDPGRGLAEIGRVLRPGGRLVVVEVDPEATDAELDRFLGRLRSRWARPPGARALLRAMFGRALQRQALAALAADRVGPGSVVRVAELPFLRLEARATLAKA